MADPTTTTVLSLELVSPDPDEGDLAAVAFLARQALAQGLVDELHIHLAPMLLGGGTPLFKPGTRQMYRQRDVRPSRNVVHLAYERV